MEMLLDMSSRMQVMEEYVAQHEQAECEQAQKDEAVRMSSPMQVTCSAGNSKEPTPRI